VERAIVFQTNLNNIFAFRKICFFTKNETYLLTCINLN